VQLPPQIRAIIEAHAEDVGFPALKRAADAMSSAYRDGRLSAVAKLPASERSAAYLATRMPATYAAAAAVLAEVRRLLAGRPVTSVLDIGAGTGAASLAACEQFPGSALTLVERDSAFAAVARECLPECTLMAEDVAGLREIPAHDLVIAAWALNEIAAPLAARLWSAARVALVIIEPGTPRGFAAVRQIRTQLLAAGARMLAPCPMAGPCPIAEPDWCHFAARVERSSLHRRLKEGELGYEDEKYSYIAVARGEVSLPESRVIRRPQHSPGLIELPSCTPQGIVTVRATKRDRERFRLARRAGWGGAGIS
jgi:ribosomal protein RSM22 (predicted rRNA methylase)